MRHTERGQLVAGFVGDALHHLGQALQSTSEDSCLQHSETLQLQRSLWDSSSSVCRSKHDQLQVIFMRVLEGICPVLSPLNNLVQWWAHLHDVTNTDHQLLTPWGLTLMVVSSLQTCSSPLLPPLHVLYQPPGTPTRTTTPLSPLAVPSSAPASDKLSSSTGITLQKPSAETVPSSAGASSNATPRWGDMVAASVDDANSFAPPLRLNTVTLDTLDTSIDGQSVQGSVAGSGPVSPADSASSFAACGLHHRPLSARLHQQAHQGHVTGADADHHAQTVVPEVSLTTVCVHDQQDDDDDDDDAGDASVTVAYGLLLRCLTAEDKDAEEADLKQRVTERYQAWCCEQGFPPQPNHGQHLLLMSQLTWFFKIHSSNLSRRLDRRLCISVWRGGTNPSTAFMGMCPACCMSIEDPLNGLCNATALEAQVSEGSDGPCQTSSSSSLAYLVHAFSASHQLWSKAAATNNLDDVRLSCTWLWGEAGSCLSSWISSRDCIGSSPSDPATDSTGSHASLELVCGLAKALRQSRSCDTVQAHKRLVDSCIGGTEAGALTYPEWRAELPAVLESDVSVCEEEETEDDNVIKEQYSEPGTRPIHPGQNQIAPQQIHALMARAAALWATAGLSGPAGERNTPCGLSPARSSPALLAATPSPASPYIHKLRHSTTVTGTVSPAVRPHASLLSIHARSPTPLLNRSSPPLLLAAVRSALEATMKHTPTNRKAEGRSSPSPIYTSATINNIINSITTAATTASFAPRTVTVTEDQTSTHSTTVPPSSVDALPTQQSQSPKPQPPLDTPQMHDAPMPAPPQGPDDTTTTNNDTASVPEPITTMAAPAPAPPTPPAPSDTFTMGPAPDADCPADASIMLSAPAVVILAPLSTSSALCGPLGVDHPKAPLVETEDKPCPTPPRPRLPPLEIPVEEEPTSWRWWTPMDLTGVATHRLSEPEGIPSHSTSSTKPKFADLVTTLGVLGRGSEVPMPLQQLSEQEGLVTEGVSQLWAGLTAAVTGHRLSEPSSNSAYLLAHADIRLVGRNTDNPTLGCGDAADVNRSDEGLLGAAKVVFSGRLSVDDCLLTSPSDVDACDASHWLKAWCGSSPRSVNDGCVQDEEVWLLPQCVVRALDGNGGCKGLIGADDESIVADAAALTLVRGDTAATDATSAAGAVPWPWLGMLPDGLDSPVCTPAERAETCMLSTWGRELSPTRSAPVPLSTTTHTALVHPSAPTDTNCLDGLMQQQQLHELDMNLQHAMAALNAMHQHQQLAGVPAPVSSLSSSEDLRTLPATASMPAPLQHSRILPPMPSLLPSGFFTPTFESSSIQTPHGDTGNDTPTRDTSSLLWAAAVLAGMQPPPDMSSVAPPDYTMLQNSPFFYQALPYLSAAGLTQHPSTKSTTNTRILEDLVHGINANITPSATTGNIGSTCQDPPAAAPNPLTAPTAAASSTPATTTTNHNIPPSCYDHLPTPSTSYHTSGDWSHLTHPATYSLPTSTSLPARPPSSTPHPHPQSHQSHSDAHTWTSSGTANPSATITHSDSDHTTPPTTSEEGDPDSPVAQPAPIMYRRVVFNQPPPPPPPPHQASSTRHTLPNHHHTCTPHLPNTNNTYNTNTNGLSRRLSLPLPNSSNHQPPPLPRSGPLCPRLSTGSDAGPTTNSHPSSLPPPPPRDRAASQSNCAHHESSHYPPSHSTTHNRLLPLHPYPQTHSNHTKSGTPNPPAPSATSWSHAPPGHHGHQSSSSMGSMSRNAPPPPPPPPPRPAQDTSSAFPNTNNPSRSAGPMPPNNSTASGHNPTYTLPPHNKRTHAPHPPPPYAPTHPYASSTTSGRSTPTGIPIAASSRPPQRSTSAAPFPPLSTSAPSAGMHHMLTSTPPPPPPPPMTFKMPRADPVAAPPPNAPLIYIRPTAQPAPGPITIMIPPPTSNHPPSCTPITQSTFPSTNPSYAPTTASYPSTNPSPTPTAAHSTTSTRASSPQPGNTHTTSHAYPFPSTASLASASFARPGSLNKCPTNTPRNPCIGATPPQPPPRPNTTDEPPRTAPTVPKPQPPSHSHSYGPTSPPTGTQQGGPSGKATRAPYVMWVTRPSGPTPPASIPTTSRTQGRSTSQSPPAPTCPNTSDPHVTSDPQDAAVDDTLSSVGTTQFVKPRLDSVGKSPRQEPDDVWGQVAPSAAQAAMLAMAGRLGGARSTSTSPVVPTPASNTCSVGSSSSLGAGDEQGAEQQLLSTGDFDRVDVDGAMPTPAVDSVPLAAALCQSAAVVPPPSDHASLSVLEAACTSATVAAALVEANDEHDEHEAKVDYVESIPPGGGGVSVGDAAVTPEQAAEAVRMARLAVEQAHAALEAAQAMASRMVSSSVPLGV